MDNDRNAPATRGNLEDVRVELKHDIAELRAEIKAELKQEVGGLRAELKQEVGGLRAELKQDIAAVRAELKQDIAALRGEAKEDNAQLRSEMQLMHEDLVERIRDRNEAPASVLFVRRVQSEARFVGRRGNCRDQKPPGYRRRTAHGRREAAEYAATQVTPAAAYA